MSPERGRLFHDGDASLASLLLFASLAVSCPQNCLECSSTGQCLRCDANSENDLIYNGVCVHSCPPKSLRLLNQCIDCHEKCGTCFGIEANQCTSCRGADVLKNWECVTPTLNPDCKLNCVHCDSQQQCLECSGNLKLLQGQCVSECPESYYMTYQLINQRESNYKCKKCHPSCKSCRGPDFQECLTCNLSNPDHKIFLQGACVSECPKGFLDQSNVCFRIPQHCLQVASTFTQCAKCETPYYLSGGKCVEQCPSSQYPQNRECLNCDHDCEKCSSLTACERCSAPQKLQNGICVGQCPDGTYVDFKIENHRQVDQQCLDCDSTCKTCSGPEENRCSSCNQEDPLHAISLEGRCVDACPSGFVERAKVCFYCGLTCETCSNPLNPEQCDTCKPGYQLNGNKCVKTCPDGTFSLDGQCQSCSSDCKRCSSATQCDECTAPAKLYKGACIASCPLGTFTKVNAIVNQHEADLRCLPCDSTCRSCSGPDPENCLSCDPNNFNHDTFYEGKCVGFCPLGYVERAHTCFKCADSCQTCSNPLNPQECDRCKPGFVFFNSQCLQSCPEGTYNYRGKCLACRHDCKRCESEISCQECTAPSKLYTGFCLSRCPDGTYVNATIIDHHFQDQKCLSCDSTCKTCGGPEPNRCISCNQEDPLHAISLEGKCVDQCPAGFVERSHVCFYCGINCATCSNPLNPQECDTCKPGFLLNGKQCVQSCPVGTFQKGKECITCSPGCLSCNSLTECTECQAPSRLFKGSCLSECPQKTYLSSTIVDHHETNLRCLDCHKTCNSCSGPQINECLSCNTQERAHDTMLEGKCVAKCPRGYVEQAKTCFPCHQSCQSCSDPNDLSVCDHCKFGYIKYQSHCIAGCPKGTYETSKQCKPCHQNCASCISDKICEECVTPFSLFKDQCMRSCPIKFFSKATQIVNHREVNFQCQACDPSCRTCSSSQVNGCLTCDTHSKEHSTSLEGKCVQDCPSKFYVQHPLAKVCLHCGPNCETCNDYLNPQICQTCESGFLLNGHQCVSECPPGTYKQGSICKSKPDLSLVCEENCATCKSSTECTSCTDNFELLDSDCVLTCPVGTFEKNSICEGISQLTIECPSSCASCSSLHECSTCAESYFFLDNYCVSECPAGTFQAQGECKGKIVLTQACSDSCLTCSSASTCLSCDISNEEHDTLFQGECLESCPDTPSVFQISSRHCQICPEKVTQIDHQYVIQTLQNCDFSISSEKELRSIGERIQKFYNIFTSYFLSQSNTPWSLEAADLIHSTRNMLIQAQVSDASYQGSLISLSRAPMIPTSLKDSFTIGTGVQIEISVPSSAISDLSKAHLGSTCFASGVYTDSTIDEYKIPLCDISLMSNGKIQKVENLKEPILIKYLFESLPVDQPLSCAYWDRIIKSFSTAGITTTRIDNEIVCSTSHLSSFQIIPFTPPIIKGPQTMSSILIIVCTLGFCILLTVIALMIDFACLRRKELPYYPHLKPSEAKGCWYIFKYSFLYNFPLVSLFSFQEASLKSYLRAFWLTDLLIIMLNIIGLLFSNEILQCDPNTANELIISFSLGLCLIPGSFIINLLAIKVRKATSKDDTQIFLAASVVNSTAQTRFIRRKCGCIFLVTTTFCLYVLGSLNLYFLSLSNSFLITFGIAVAAGCVFSLLKIILSSVVAYKHHQNPGLFYDLCVDVLTDMVAYRTRQGNQDVTFTSSQPSRITFNN